MERPAYDYAVFSGDAPDEYGDLIIFDDPAEYILCLVLSNDVMLRISMDGETELDERRILENRPTMLGFKALGFSIRNRVAGMTAQYQIIPMR